MTDVAKFEPPAAEPPVENPRRGRWKFWGTTLWGVAIIAASILCAILAVANIRLLDPPSADPVAVQLRELLFSEDEVLIAGVAGSTFGVLVVIALAVLLSRVRIRDYLALKPPRPRDLMTGVAGLVFLSFALSLAGHFFGPLPSSTEMVSPYHSALVSGRLPAFALTVIVLAPVSEELLVRGFLLPGWAASWLRPTGAIVLTAALWALAHWQYEWIATIDIFAIGLLFGWIRLRGGSTMTTILLHATQNAAGLAIVAISYPPA